MQYCCKEIELASITSHVQNWVLFLLWLHPFILSGVISPLIPRNSVDLTEAEDIKKRWQEHTEELNKKYLHDPDNHNHMITHLESDILYVKSSGP